MPLRSSIHELLEGNRRWVERCSSEDIRFFARQAEGQSPPFLFIGCADSRVPPTNITNTGPGDLFVTRNIANLVTHDDMAVQSSLEYALTVLKVEHVIVCGHTACGGVTAALRGAPTNGALGAWLAPLRALADQARDELEKFPPEARVDRLVELNVKAQVMGLEKHPLVQEARTEREVQIHGSVYDLHQGRVRTLV